MSLSIIFHQNNPECHRGLIPIFKGVGSRSTVLEIPMDQDSTGSAAGSEALSLQC